MAGKFNKTEYMKIYMRRKRAKEKKMGYYDPLVTESKNKNVKLGRTIYMSALSGRRGFRDDQLGIEDADIWEEIFEELGKLARAAVEIEKESKR